MFTYYKLSDDGKTIEMATTNAKSAQMNGMAHKTTRQIVHGYDGKLYFDNTVPENKPDYKQMRLSKYPSIANQLDMLYWDYINGTSTWTDTISEIKNEYPKP